MHQRRGDQIIHHHTHRHEREICRLFDDAEHACAAAERLGVRRARHTRHIVDQHDRDKHRQRNQQHVEICRERADHARDQYMNKVFHFLTFLSVTLLQRRKR